MAIVYPFRGVRYNPEQIGDLAAVVTPPYDVIDNKAQDEYYRRHPYNIIRLELGYRHPEDSDTDNRYTRAARDYNLWLQKGVLTAEPRPAIYLYEQQFAIGDKSYSRTGIFVRVGLEEYSAGVILPHEETLSRPKADRMALMLSCQANFSPVFALYEDPAGVLEQEFAAYKSGQPEVNLTDEFGERHLIWVISDQELHQRVTAFFVDKPLFIADGHHRYETALNFFHAVGRRYPGASSIMMQLCSTSDQGLVVLPTHRILHSLPGLLVADLLPKLNRNFLVEKLSPSQPDDLTSILGEAASRGKTAFIMAAPGGEFYLLTLKNREAMSPLSQEHCEAWRELDVSVLQVLVLQDLLGLDREKMAGQTNLTYTREVVTAIDALQNGSGQLAFLLNPTRVEQITAVASAGDKMPQKSTYFHPKLLTGLIINDLTL